MAKKASIYAAVVGLALCALFAGGYWLMHRRSAELCSICQRHINPEAHVVVEIGGRRRDVCCAHCALTEGRQENKPVKFIEVTDYTTGKGLDPQHAWFVDGSRVVACEHDMAKMGEMNKRIKCHLTAARQALLPLQIAKQQKRSSRRLAECFTTWPRW